MKEKENDEDMLSTLRRSKRRRRRERSRRQQTSGDVIVEPDLESAAARKVRASDPSLQDGARFFLRVTAEVRAVGEHQAVARVSSSSVASSAAGIYVADSVITEASVIQRVTTLTTASSTRILQSKVSSPASTWIQPERPPPVQMTTDPKQTSPALLSPSESLQPLRQINVSYSYERELADWIEENRGGRFEKILHVDIVDFDNCLFKSPVPDDKVWDSALTWFLKSTTGRWFQDVRTLSEPYVPTRKEGFISDMSEIVRSSNDNERALTVLLTGRMGSEYRRRIDDLLALTDLRFDIVCLKEYPVLPNGAPSTFLPTTMEYKLRFLHTLLERLPGVKTMSVWDDRKHHADRFRHWLGCKQQCGRLADVASHAVLPRFGYVPYDLERELVFQLVDEHNRRAEELAKKGAANEWQGARAGGGRPEDRKETRKVQLMTKGVNYTGVILDVPSVRLLLKNFPPHDDTWRVTADHITLCPGPATPEDIKRAGGLGKQYSIRITHVGCLPGRAFAVRVKSAKGSPRLLTEARYPHVTIAYNSPAGARAKDSKLITDWKPVNCPYTLSGTLGVRPIIGMRWE